MKEKRFLSDESQMFTLPENKCSRKRIIIIIIIKRILSDKTQMSTLL